MNLPNNISTYVTTITPIYLTSEQSKLNTEWSKYEKKLIQKFTDSWVDKSKVG